MLAYREEEESIYQRERYRIAQTHPELVDLVLPRFKMKRAGLGYDILSFDENGEPICIEVKTTTGDTIDFSLSRREVQTAEKMTAEGTPYYINRITGWASEHQMIRNYLFTHLDQAFEPGTQ